MQEFLINLLGISDLEALKFVFLGNTLGDYLTAGVALVVFLVVLKFVQWLVLNRLRKIAERTKTDIDDALIKIVRTIKPPFYSFVAFYFAVTAFLSLSAVVTRVMTVTLVVWLVYQAIGAIQVLIDYVVAKALGGEESEDAKVAAGLIGKISKIALWIIGLLLVLSNFGINVNSLIAGMGIGGIAIAFALQGILSDLFSSFAIYFDKPFVVGDFIAVGDSSGTVERIGIKTTRLRSDQGEELVISNQELTTARVQNFKKVEARRVKVILGVLYETPTELLREIPKILEKIVEDVELARLNRVHFVSFDDFALTFELVYFIDSPEHSVYMDARQEINFQIKTEFEKRGISMAYPTQTLYIEGGDAKS